MQNYSDKPVNYFGHARSEIAPLLAPQYRRVLELGCGAGATLHWLSQSMPDLYTVGVEIDSEAAQRAAAHVHEVHCMNFEQSALPPQTPAFDLILCLDVLEHMVDPWRTVDRLVADHLSPGGQLLISLPNVRHYSVVLPLLLRGRWTYEEAGLLDRTHLRFFTRASATQLLSHSMLTPARYMATGFELSTRKGLLNRLTAGIFQELFTYQHFLSATKR